MHQWCLLSCFLPKFERSGQKNCFCFALAGIPASDRFRSSKALRGEAETRQHFDTRVPCSASSRRSAFPALGPSDGRPPRQRLQSARATPAAEVRAEQRRGPAAPGLRSEPPGGRRSRVPARPALPGSTHRPRGQPRHCACSVRLPTRARPARAQPVGARLRREAGSCAAAAPPGSLRRAAPRRAERPAQRRVCGAAAAQGRGL